MKIVKNKNGATERIFEALNARLKSDALIFLWLGCLIGLGMLVAAIVGGLRIVGWVL